MVEAAPLHLTFYMGCPLGRPVYCLHQARLACCLLGTACASRPALPAGPAGFGMRFPWNMPARPIHLRLALAAPLGLRYLARRPAPLVARQAPARSGLKEFSSPAWSGTGRRLAPARARPAALTSTGFSCLFCIAGTSTSALPAGRFPPQLICSARLALSACQLATAC